MTTHSALQSWATVATVAALLIAVAVILASGFRR